jgi:thienamycin biosynthesis protein ThnN
VLTTPDSAAHVAAPDGAESRLRRVLAIHLDPHGGSRYWLERQARLGFDLRAEIRDIRDLPRVGTMNPTDLAQRPLHDFVPRSRAGHARNWILAQTGGATGNPVWTVYAPDEFDAAFVAPFSAAAAHVHFPRGGTWLYAGPSGPHIIGRAARHLARAMGAPEPFSIDFDPRWARKLPDGSFAQPRYVEHVVDQALAVLQMQPIDVLFTTPPLLAALAPRMSDSQRERVRGLHYGGTHLSRAALTDFQSCWFPRAVHLSGYGNTLFGCCLELDTSPGRVPSYFPHGDRLIFDAPASEESPPARRPIRFSRLDETMLLINVAERDAAERVAPPRDAPEGFCLPGVRDVGPSGGADTRATGLY